MARIEKTVFISYRRTDVYTALAVYQDLTVQGYDVFFDYTSIPSGDFEQIIVGNIKARAHFLLVLTPTALDRCNEPDDWLRREIETAMDEGRNIIPLFFKGFQFGNPSVAEKLTGKLQHLSRYNGLNVHEDYFSAAMERLSDKYLNVPLDMVLHPVSTAVRRKVEEEKVAANRALGEQKTGTQTLVGNSTKKQSQNINKSNLRFFGIGTVVLLGLAICVLGAYLLNQYMTLSDTPTPAEQISTMTVTPESSVDSTTPSATSDMVISENTETVITPTLTMTPIPPTPTLGIGSTRIGKDGMVQNYVPAGEFTMGSNDGDSDERPPHKVFLAAYWIDQTEVTNAMYAQCVNAGSCSLPSDATFYSNSSYANHPVVYVSWSAAKAYCSWAARRLPTEAEWEKAARGTNANIYPWGDNAPNDNLLNYKTLGTVEVGRYPDGISPYGAFDMAGNVIEWVDAWYDAYPGHRGNKSEYFGVTHRVIRGGSFVIFYSDARATDRVVFDPNLGQSNFLGFRCAVSE